MVRLSYSPIAPANCWASTLVSGAGVQCNHTLLIIVPSSRFTEVWLLLSFHMSSPWRVGGGSSCPSVTASSARQQTFRTSKHACIEQVHPMHFTKLKGALWNTCELQAVAIFSAKPNGEPSRTQPLHSIHKPQSLGWHFKVSLVQLHRDAASLRMQASCTHAGLLMFFTLHISLSPVLQFLGQVLD